MKKNAIIDLKNISVAFGNNQVLKNLNLYIRDKEFITLLGPSGCGKTTTLRIIAGFVEPDEGEVIFEGKKINSVPPHKRQVNTIFQRYALFPHLNVYENVAFGLRIKKIPEKQIKEIEALGQDKLPVCIAKTQYSLSDNPALLGRPKNFRITVRSLSLSSGAGFIVALTGDIMTMPGLPKSPAAYRIDVDRDGVISGLF